MSKSRRQLQKKSADPEANTVYARQSLRYRVLRRIHEMTEGAVERTIYPGRLADYEGLSVLELEQVLCYLRDEKLIEAPQGNIYKFSLKHKGLVEVERAILDPSAGTEHFDAKVTSAFRKDRKGKTMTMRLAGDGES